MIIEKNVLLKPYTTFKIGGRARYFVRVKTENEILRALKFSKLKNLPIFVLGGGSNVLISDNGFSGLVIKMENSNYEILEKKIFCEIKAQTGISLAKLVQISLKNSLTGLEWAVGIPGTLGGAIYGNAGAFGHSISECLKEVKFIDRDSLKVKSEKAKKLDFKYRESIFKRKKNLIILEGILRLKKGKKEEIEKRITNYLQYKKTFQPLDCFSAGCIFKNPEGMSAGALIEKCGLKGKKIGDVKISEKHANFILNLGKGKAQEVKKLINLIKKEVKRKFKIELEEEIQILENS